jgi:hypothetical protein
VTCLEVRDRLPEHSLGVLPKTDAREVERHLDWCPGCRKEASELVEGASSMGLALPVSSPTSSLEGRIVERFRMASGRTSPPSRGRLRVLVAATMAAAFLALGSLGWAVSQQGKAQTTEELLSEAQQQNNALLTLIDTFKSSGRTHTATLMAPSGGRGFGQAIVFSAPGNGYVLVDIPVLPQSPGPFKLQLVGSAVIDGGQLNGGDHVVALKWFTDKNLSKVTTVTVIDESTGAVALTGKVQPYIAVASS